MKVLPWLSGFLCLVILTSSFPAQPANAAPGASPTSGMFWVNSNADTNEYDPYLTLREAMLAANGAPTHPFSPAEQAQMPGCIFNESGNITGGCGSGGDTILFTAEVTQITPLSPLPIIVKGTLIMGSAGRPVIDLQAVGPNEDGFLIHADDVWIYNLSIINQPGIGGAITTGFTAHKGLRVVGNYLGVTPTTTSCSDPAIVDRPYFTLSIDDGLGTAAPGDGTAYIYDNVIGCSQNEGINIWNASYVYIGQAPDGSLRPNYIGVTRAGDNIGNLAHGIILCCSTDNRGNVIAGNKIGYNTWDGIILDNVSETTVSNNEVHHNGYAGILVQASNRSTLANNLSHHNSGSGIQFDQFEPTPLTTFFNAVTGGASYANTAAGITEGGGANNNSWSQVSVYGNSGLGIDKSANGSVDAPPLLVTGITPAAQGVLVSGTISVSSSVLTKYKIELFRAARDASGYGEGKMYLGSANFAASAPGIYPWSIPDPLGAVCYTATLTISDPINTLSASSSEFSLDLGLQCNLTFVPAVRR